MLSTIDHQARARAGLHTVESDRRSHGGGDDIEMFEVAKVEYLQIETVGTSLFPAFHRCYGVIDHSGNSPLARLVGVVSNGR
jgi:hypothetical protein